MQRFADLFTQLDTTNKTNAKVDALADYFRETDDRDRLWTIALMSGRRPKRTVNTTLLRTWAAEYGGVPLWLFEESYRVVGDLAETIALVLPDASELSDLPLTHWVEYVKDLGNYEEDQKRERIFDAWGQLTTTERFLFNKLITGQMRVGVSQKLMTRALGKALDIEQNSLMHRLMGNWTPDTTTFEDLILSENPLDDISKPYPFYLAYPLEADPRTLGEVSAWQAERKWDGIRGQIVVREGQIFVWSRGEDLVTEKFPEYKPLAELLPDGTVIDGEILPFKDGRPLTFNALQTRIGRKNVTKKILDASPVVVMAYDLLEWRGEDIRQEPLERRRGYLEQLVEDYDTQGLIVLSEIVPATDWSELEAVRKNSREFHSEGLMLKQHGSPYLAGRKRGDWYKWKIEPLTVDAVMIYAQRGSGRRANLYTDYTFAVWDGDELVPFTKAYSGMTDAEFNKMTAWVRRNTLERYGPVRKVKIKHVFEIGFEGIQRSTRHKSGVALRFPRMLRWRHDKPVEEANTLEDLHRLLELYG